MLRFAEIGWPAALEDVDALDDFIGVAGHATERLVHIGDERDDFFPMRWPVSTMTSARRMASSSLP